MNATNPDGEVNSATKGISPAGANAAGRVSKRRAAKNAQGYVDKLALRSCGNCAHYTSKFETVRYNGYSVQTWQREYDIRCGIGLFKVKKLATCQRFEPKAGDSASRSSTVAGSDAGNADALNEKSR